jgi:cytochrome P450
LITAAVEELLRYDGPVQTTARIAKEDLEMGGKQIQTGQRLIACLGAANRDPAHFPEPDQLNLQRTVHRHLAFGQGSHFCLGAPLAHLEIEIALQTLLERFPTLRLGMTTPAWQSSLVFRRLKELPVVFS